MKEETLMQVTKRTGQLVDFDSFRIFNAVKTAANRIHEKAEAEELARRIESIVKNDLNYEERDEVTADELQASVEGLLIKLDPEVALAYVDYRTKREVERNGITNITKSVERVIAKDKAVINENANKDGNKFPVIRDLTAGSVAKAIGLKKMLPKRVANAHIKGDIHFHDLDYMPYSPMTNCCLINFKDIFENGTRVGNATIESPKSIQTAVALTAQIIANVSSNQYGGCSFDRVDEVLAPYATLNLFKHNKASIKFAAELKGIELSEAELDELAKELVDRENV